MAAADALAYVGLPEAAYHLTEATIYLAAAPKSTSGPGHGEDAQLVTDGPAASVPPHLRSAAYPGPRSWVMVRAIDMHTISRAGWSLSSTSLTESRPRPCTSLGSMVEQAIKDRLDAIDRAPARGSGNR